jgi:3-oxoadipate enol-lactonase
MVRANGIQIHYERMPAKRTSGDATPPTVVLVHGLGTDNLASLYMTLAAPLAAAGNDVIAYDLRGHGRTDKPATGYRISDFVADLDGLLDEVGVEAPVHLVGNSFGGTLTFSYAATHPARTASLVSIDTEPATEQWAEKMGRTLDGVMQAMAREEYFVEIRDQFGVHAARMSRDADRRLRTTSMVRDIPSGPVLAPDALRAIRCPVLSIVGSEGFQYDNLAALRSVLPDARIEVLEGQDHYLVLRSHRTVRALLLDWIADYEVSAAGVA